MMSNNRNFTEQLTWKVDDIAHEFQMSRATVFRRLKEAKLTNSGDGTYTTGQVAEALYGDYTGERTKLLRLKQREVATRIRQMEGSVVDVDELTRVLTSVFLTIPNIVLGSTLPKRDQDALLEEIASVTVIVDPAVKRSQQKAGVNAETQGEETDDAE